MKNTDKFQDKEIWKEIQGLEGLYAVSNKGRVMNLKNGRILAGSCNNSGYRTIFLKGKGRTIHRLVALAFVPNPNKLPQVDHIDEVKTNNNASNLRWVSKSENVRRSIYKQFCKVKQLDLYGNLIRVWDSVHQIGEELGYDISAIVKCCKGKQQYTRGFRWQYMDSSSQRSKNRPVIAYKGNEVIGEFPSASKASEALGLNYGSLNYCLRGRMATLKGYRFRYK